ncbi:cysteine-rich VLP protein [Enterocloster clostridioformis]
MPPMQRKRANALIRRACCSCEGGNCTALDDGDACTRPQMKYCPPFPH